MKKSIVFLLTTLFLASCGVRKTPEPKPEEPQDFTNVSFESASYVYDGKEHILDEVKGAPSGTTITYAGRESYTDVGIYEASAYLVKEGYNSKTLNATLTISNASFSNITFNDQTVEYDGQEHVITVANLPSFASVTYTNNKGTEVGTYNATATITAPNYNNLVLHATLSITEPLKDFTDAYMNDLTVNYDGKSHTIEPGGYPDGTTITYSGTKSYTNAGTYTITCTLSKSGYHNKTLSATLTINGIPFSGLVFEDKTAFYDGKAHSITVENAPKGSKITYKQVGGTGTNTFTAKGTYVVEATVSCTNYITTKLQATLTIGDYMDVLGVDEDTKPYIPEGELTYDEVFDTLMNMNYTVVTYSGARGPDEEIHYDEADSHDLYACDGTNFFHHSYYVDSLGEEENEYDFYYVAEEDTAHTTFQLKYDRIYKEKLPTAAMDETIRKSLPARALMAYQKAQDGTLISGVDLDDFYSDVGTYEIRGDRLFLKHEHDRDNGQKFFYEVYEFYNIGNTTIDVVDSLVPNEEELEEYTVQNNFIIDGVKYGSHLVSTWNSPTEYMAHTYLYHWQMLILEKGVHTVYPIMYDKVVQRVVYNYYSEVNIYNYNMSGYELNLYFNEDGTYQDQYASLGTVTDRTSGFVSHGGVVHYYDEWAIN